MIVPMKTTNCVSPFQILIFFLILDKETIYPNKVGDKSYCTENGALRQ